MKIGSGIFDKMIEVVDSFSPTENEIYDHTFSYDGLNGSYFIVTDPPGNIDNMLAESSLPTVGLFNFTYFFVGGSPKTIRSQYTSTYRPNIAGYADYWTPTITVTDGTISVNLAGLTRLQYRIGYTYYLCRVKQ